MAQLAAASLVLIPARASLGTVAYLGRLALLAMGALRAMIRPRSPSAPLSAEVAAQAEWMLAAGIPLTALIHVGMGSFLAMQAYFGATFVDGIGPVVGVGLIRNLAPMLVGFLMAGLLASRVVPELRGPVEGEPARLAAARLLAAGLVGPVLAAWGSAVGIGVGWVVARSTMGVTFPAFFDMFVEMLWARDVVGLVVKGSVFGFLSALFACHEGLTSGEGAAPEGPASGRAACLAGFSILFLNSAWFLLIYHAGPAFGPTVLAPPQG